MYHAFGFSAPRVFIGLILFSMLYQPVEHVLGFLGNIWSRNMEFEGNYIAILISRLSIFGPSFLFLF